MVKFKSTHKLEIEAFIKYSMSDGFEIKYTVDDDGYDYDEREAVKRAIDAFEGKKVRIIIEEVQE